MLTKTPFREGWNWPRSSIPTVDTVENAELCLEVARGNFERIGKTVRMNAKGILAGLIAECAIIDIPSKTRNPRHQVMMLASILTQYVPEN